MQGRIQPEVREGGGNGATEPKIMKNILFLKNTGR